MNNKKTPLVSIIIATYNRAELIGETIQSILNQIYNNFEIIIVDDGSDDYTKEVVNSFNDLRIHYIYTENWGGPARPRNIGINKATGEYIAFCDDDDYWHKNKLAEQIKYFEDENLIGVGTGAILFGDLPLHKKKKKLKSDLILDFNSLLTEEKPPLSSLVVRNKGFLFDENKKFKFVEDFEFQLRITSATNMKIKLIAEPLIYYRIHPNNASNELINAENALGVIEKYKNLISEKYLYKAYYKRYFNLGVKSLRSDKQHAKKYFTLAGKYSSGKMKYLSFLLSGILRLPPVLINKLMLIYYKN